MKNGLKWAAAATAIAMAGTGLAVVQNASAATVKVTGELCTYTYTQADADYLDVANDAIEEVEARYRESDRNHRSYFSGRSVWPGESTTIRVSEAEEDLRWDSHRGVEVGVDSAIESAKNSALYGLNSRRYSPKDSLFLASWEQNSYARFSLLQHEIDKACVDGGTSETQTPKDPDFSPDKFPVWDLGEEPEETTSEETTPEESTPETPTPTVTAEPTLPEEPSEAPSASGDPEPTDESPEPSAEPTEGSEDSANTTVVTTTVKGRATTITVTTTPSQEPEGTTPASETTEPTPEKSPEGSSDSDSTAPFLLVGGLAALIGTLVAAAPFLISQLQTLAMF